MKRALAQSEHKWLTVQGLLAVLFGITALAWPGITLEVLAYLVAAFLILYGVVGLVQGLMHYRRSGLALTVISAVAEMAIGVVFLWQAGVAALTIALFVGLLFVVRGVFSLTAITRARRRHPLRLLVAGGELVIGAGLLAYPVGSLFALVWLVGLYAVITGVVLLLTANSVSKASS